MWAKYSGPSENGVTCKTLPAKTFFLNLLFVELVRTCNVKEKVPQKRYKKLVDKL